MSISCCLGIEFFLGGFIMNDHHKDFLSQLLKETEVMAMHAYGSGLQVPAEVLEVLESSDALLSNKHSPGHDERKELTKKLSSANCQLAEIVAPALPRTLRLIHEEKNKKGLGSLKTKLGPVPLIQGLVAAAIFSLVGFLALSGIDLTDNDPYLARSIEFLILLFAAAMGASFTALYRVNRLVVNGTYDAKYNSSYWIRFVLGLIAGVMLAQVISQIQPDLQQFGKTILAIIGGFSASVVYRILTRMAEAIESIFIGDESERIAAEEQG